MNLREEQHSTWTDIITGGLGTCLFNQFEPIYGGHSYNWNWESKWATWSHGEIGDSSSGIGGGK
jgi:hypothetical protein